MYPLPNNQSTTIGTNHQFIQPTYDTRLYQPALRLDYQLTPGLRFSFKYAGNNNAKRASLGTLPGWNDTIVPIPQKGSEVVTVNYNISSTTFLEGTYGRAGNQLAGCGGLSINDVADSRTTGLADLPLIFPDANVINPDYYAFEILNYQNPPYWDGTRIFKVPAFQWGNRVTLRVPPNVIYPGFLNINTTQDVAINLTQVRGRHTLKAGFYNNHSLKRENNVLGGTNFGTINFSQDTVGVNPFDTSFGFANAAIGSFSSFIQASKYVEGHVHLRQPRGVRPGQLEGEVQLVDGLRRPLRARDAPARPARCRAATSCPTSGWRPRLRPSTCRLAPTAPPRAPARTGRRRTR